MGGLYHIMSQSNPSSSSSVEKTEGAQLGLWLGISTRNTTTHWQSPVGHVNDYFDKGTANQTL